MQSLNQFYVYLSLALKEWASDERGDFYIPQVILVIIGIVLGAMVLGFGRAGITELWDMAMAQLRALFS